MFLCLQSIIALCLWRALAIQSSLSPPPRASPIQGVWPARSRGPSASCAVERARFVVRVCARVCVCVCVFARACVGARAARPQKQRALFSVGTCARALVCMCVCWVTRGAETRGNSVTLYSKQSQCRLGAGPGAYVLSHGRCVFRMYK